MCVYAIDRAARRCWKLRLGGRWRWHDKLKYDRDLANDDLAAMLLGEGQMVEVALLFEHPLSLEAGEVNRLIID